MTLRRRSGLLSLKNNDVRPLVAQVSCRQLHHLEDYFSLFTLQLNLCFGNPPFGKDQSRQTPRNETLRTPALKLTKLMQTQAAAGEDAILNDDDGVSQTSSDPGTSVLLAASPQEQALAMEEEASEAASFPRPPCPAYAELLEVMERAAGRLQLPWQREREETARGRLDERFLSGHNPVTPSNLAKRQNDVHQMIQDRIKRIEEIQDSVELRKRNTEKDKSSSVEIFTDLIFSTERIQSEQLKMMEKQQKEAEKQAEDFINELQQEITELEKRNTELEQLSHTDNHLHLIQMNSSLYIRPHTTNWTEIRIDSDMNVISLYRTVALLRKTQETLNKKLSQTGLKFVQTFAVDVTLDPDTAHPRLILSDDGKQVSHGHIEQDVPKNPKRFDKSSCVLAKEGFSSGRFYYEVQVKGKTRWGLGVARESINRKETITLSPDNGYWTVNEYAACDSQLVYLSLRVKPEKVGVFVDYEEGLVSFYNVGSRSHIYSFTGQTFPDKLYPYFGPGFNDKGPEHRWCEDPFGIAPFIRVRAPMGSHRPPITIPSPHPATIPSLQSFTIPLPSPRLPPKPPQALPLLFHYGERKQKAVMSCLTCQSSYCVSHLEPHLRVPRLKKHKLINAVENLEDYICQKHERPLEMFCRDDQKCVCLFCTEGEHRTHNTVPIEEESREKKINLANRQTDIHQMIQDRTKKIQDIQHSVELRKRNTEQSSSVEIFTDLIHSIQRCQFEQLKMKEEQQKVEKWAEDLINELQQEITALKKRNTELEQLSHTDDHLHVIQWLQLADLSLAGGKARSAIYSSLYSHPHTKTWTESRIDSDVNVISLIGGLLQLKKTQTINEKLSQTVGVTLDPDTANPSLILSDDGKQVSRGDNEQDVPENPKRFDKSPCVLAKQGFSSGRFYYEVQLRVKPEKVGVFVDYEEGLVSFYDVDSRSHIYSFTGQTFTDKLYPIFYPGLANEDTGHALGSSQLWLHWRPLSTSSPLVSHSTPPRTYGLFDALCPSTPTAAADSSFPSASPLSSVTPASPQSSGTLALPLTLIAGNRGHLKQLRALQTGHNSTCDIAPLHQPSVCAFESTSSVFISHPQMLSATTTSWLIPLLTPLWTVGTVEHWVCGCAIGCLHLRHRDLLPVLVFLCMYSHTCHGHCQFVEFSSV
ncbi:E3 ubiquitin-protein ligase TRIM39 [Anabarilius grahami]|uniref:E3 ubiquitin-protein ligase TRIM39 n=1 Tax=Anabarilius grahami TaxID=495550 RepID=A0A3N0YG83_ANAGA|nr:E3 ubiquitin-protein ligase TRIM39 [Anabarilius grahami]